MVNAELVARLQSELKQVREAEVVAWRKVLDLDRQLLNAQNVWFSQETREQIYEEYCKFERAHERLVNIGLALEGAVVAVRRGNYDMIAEGLV